MLSVYWELVGPRHISLHIGVRNESKDPVMIPDDKTLAMMHSIVRHLTLTIV